MELLAPGGDIDSIKAAVIGGADAVYCGLDRFNARNRAANITYDALPGIIRFAHEQNCQIFLTMNILMLDNEFPALITLLNRLVNSGVDAVIVQDLGLFHLIQNHFPSLNVHASTQNTTHNEGQIRFLKQFGATRTNLSRELTFEEIRHLTEVSHALEMETEVFVHGSNCISFSGACYISSVTSGNSGNRGRCSQPCRDQFETTPAGFDYPLNMKDNNAFGDLETLSDIGVDSIKIEGRIKKFHYVYAVVKEWHEQLKRFYNSESLHPENETLHRLFNRDFTTGYLTGEIGRDMFIDNPMDHSALRFVQREGGAVAEAKKRIYDERTGIIESVRSLIDTIDMEKEPATLTATGERGEVLTIELHSRTKRFTVTSTTALSHCGTSEKPLDHALLLKNFRGISESAFTLETLNSASLPTNLTLPLKELTSMRKEMLSVLNDSRDYVKPVELPKSKRQRRERITPSLMLLINREEDISLANGADNTLCFELPNSYGESPDRWIELFSKNPFLIPWFPALSIGEQFDTACAFLEKVQPKRIVTNNSGVAYEAARRGIEWIAGPQFNVINSYSLEALNEQSHCVGSFVSNEISRKQIGALRKPESFSLHYSIYQPIVVMTTRQCLTMQVEGCEKACMDDRCLTHCRTSNILTTPENERFVVHKERGYYHALFNGKNFLNTEIITDIPDLFDSFLVDLRDITTDTTTALEKRELIPLFEKALHGDSSSLKEVIRETTSVQYDRGI